jgi:hypothetical protein
MFDTAVTLAIERLFVIVVQFVGIVFGLTPPWTAAGHLARRRQASAAAPDR